MEKIVVLNSGGFDSVCLMNLVREMYPGYEIHSLFFEYGQYSNEVEYAKRVAEKIGAIFKEISLPIFDWTKNDFYMFDIKQGKNEYIEMRNLVFLSYALSYAEAIGSKCIACAISIGSDRYYDTSKKFLDDFETISKSKGVSLWTPYSGKDKLDMFYDVVKFSVKIGDFYSCNSPNGDGSPCGKCDKCTEVKELYDFIKEHKINL